MVQLSSLDKERVREHLGYNIPRGVPAGLEMRIAEAMNAIRSNYAYSGTGGITYWLNRCDNALIASDPSDSNCYTQRQLILGDVNRSTTTVSSRDIDFWWELYLKQTDQLAFKLNVPNLRRPEMAQMLWVRYGSDYVKGIAGPPDTCISDRIYLAQHYA
jgi:hypothetical protein